MLFLSYIESKTQEKSTVFSIYDDLGHGTWTKYMNTTRAFKMESSEIYPQIKLGQYGWSKFIKFQLKSVGI